MKKNRSSIGAAVAVMVLGGCAPGVSSLSGLYSAAHPVTVEGKRVEVDAYLNIDRNGRLTAYSVPENGAGGACYRLAAGTDTNAGLQGLLLKPATAPTGDPSFEVQAGVDRFGILAKPSPEGNVLWYLHSDAHNNTVNVHGLRNIVTDGPHSFSISGAPLSAPPLNILRNTSCPGY
jgi:hypothetical protein